MGYAVEAYYLYPLFLLQSVCFGPKLVFDSCSDNMVNSILTLPKLRDHGFDLFGLVFMHVFGEFKNNLFICCLRMSLCWIFLGLKL